MKKAKEEEEFMRIQKELLENMIMVYTCIYMIETIGGLIYNYHLCIFLPERRRYEG